MQLRALSDSLGAFSAVGRDLQDLQPLRTPNHNRRRVRDWVETDIYMDGMPEEAVAITTHSRADADSRDDAEQAFQRAVLPERPRLYALALTITRDPAEGEDIVQETMLSAWRSWAQVRDPTHPGPWLTVSV